MELYHLPTVKVWWYRSVQYSEKIAKKSPHLFSQQRAPSCHPNELFIDLANAAYIYRLGNCLSQDRYFPESILHNQQRLEAQKASLLFSTASSLFHHPHSLTHGTRAATRNSWMWRPERVPNFWPFIFLNSLHTVKALRYQMYRNNVYSGNLSRLLLSKLLNY